MPQKRMGCPRLLFDHLAWIKHQFLRGIRDSRKKGVCEGWWEVCEEKGSQYTGVDWPKGYGYYVEVLKEFRKRFRRKRPALFKSGQWYFNQDNTPVDNSILVTDYLTKMGIKTVPPPFYSQDLAPYDFWLFPKLRGCRYDTIEEMKEDVTKVIDTLRRTSMGTFRSC